MSLGASSSSSTVGSLQPSPCITVYLLLYRFTIIRPSLCILMYPMYPASFLTSKNIIRSSFSQEKPWDFLLFVPPKRANFRWKSQKLSWPPPEWRIHRSQVPGHWASQGATGPLEPSPVPNRPNRRIRRLVVVDALSKDQAFCFRKHQFGDSFLENLWKSMKMEKVKRWKGEKVLWDQRSLSPWDLASWG